MKNLIKKVQFPAEYVEANAYPLSIVRIKIYILLHK